MKPELLFFPFDLMGMALLTELARHALLRIVEKLGAVRLAFGILAPSAT